MLQKKEFNSLIDMTRDVLAHPEKSDGRVEDDYLKSILSSDVFTDAELRDIQEALRIITEDPRLSDAKKFDLINNSWKVNYIQRPPTPAEFLTPAWIGNTANGLFPHIRKAFLDFFDEIKNYRILVGYYPIGAGKSTLTVLIKTYIAVMVYYMRNWKQFLNQNDMGFIVDCTVSINLDMARDLILAPLTNLISASPKFARVKMEDQLLRKREEDPTHIYWTTATGGRSMMRIGEYHFITASDMNQYLGYSVLSASITEITYLINKGGMTDSHVWQLYTDLKERLQSRFGENYLSKFILDSSPNSLDNRIDRYMWKDCLDNPKILQLHGTKWDLQPYLFTEWQKDHSKVFPVFIGSASRSPKIIEPKNEKDYDQDSIIHMPIDLLQTAKDNLSRVIQNYGGMPTGLDEKLITDFNIINDMFINTIPNFYTFERAPASKPPEDLLWGLVRPIFFKYTGRGNQYQFYRNPDAERFISIDLAKKHDMAAISMVHLELNTKGETVFVVDFSLPIMSSPSEEINLDSFKYLVWNMVMYGGINCHMVSFDQFQSDSSRQYLLRLGLDVINFSVDRTTEPYLSFVSLLQNRRVKMGKNIIMKNNLKSLVFLSENGKHKIDHVKGDWEDLDNQDWYISKMGYFGKDVSDSVVAAINLAQSYGHKPSYIFDQENLNIEPNLDNILEEIKQRYHLVPSFP